MGAFRNVAPQPGLPSIEELMDRYARVSLADDRLVYVQLLLYGLDMKAPTAADARAWAEHYRMDRSKNRVVLAGTSEFVNDASYAMIPGFQLVDKNFILRAESSGHRPRHDLYRELLPMIPQLLH